MGRNFNLIDDDDITRLLIAEPLEWRVRAVDEVIIDSASGAHHTRSLQVGSLDEVLAKHPGPPVVPADEETILIALPLATVARGPLLEFSVEGPYGQGWLLPRLEIARREAAYLKQLVLESATDWHPDLDLLLPAILGFPGSVWLQPRGNAKLEDFLKDGLGRTPDREEVAKWREISHDCRQVLRPLVDRFVGYSAPENPILALPRLDVAVGPLSDARYTALLSTYRDLVVAMAASTHPAAGDFLMVLADYGNHYELIVGLEVPVRGPFSVAYSERVQMDLSIWTNSGAVPVVVADAQTNHVSFRVDDPTVRIAAFQARTPALDQPASFAYSSRQDAQSRSFYAYDPERDFRVALKFTLAPLLRLQLMNLLVGLVLVGLALGLGLSNTDQASSLAVSAGPAALAGTILLVRNTNTLQSRLQLGLSVWLFGALATLLTTVGWLALKAST